MKNIKKSYLIIGGILLLLAMNGCSSYNKMVELEENSITQWANVNSAYQRRADLIPNLVNTVKGYAKHEKETFREVIEARAKATSINVDPSKLTPETIKQFQEAQNGISSALGKLMVVVERYPDLKANQNFLELQAQLEGTENRINTERNKYNKITGEYNKKIKKMPGKLYNMLFGFEERVRFEAEEGAEKAVKVEF
ncbi:MAG: LemA family protein [Bacteroidetes bacterium]|nr:MAG: LemA family protein [Bacteroidota bacterium]